jgi:cytochrome c oxidase subunit 4
MEENKTSEHSHSTGFGIYILVWLGLISLTALTVSVAGVHLGSLTLFIALLIAAVKSSLVINIFMHIKFEDSLFKFFFIISLITLVVIFILTFIDYTSRG